MKTSTKSYPHPVLGNEDDVGGIFKPEFRYELGRQEVVLNPSFSIKNDAIEDLIKRGKASYIIEVECRSTFFRRSFSTRRQSERFDIAAPLLRDRVSVGFFVCADEEIRQYRPSQAHSDYEGAAFELDAGDILAVGGHCSFIAEKSFDPLRPPISSFVAIREGSHHEGPMDIDYDTDKITIILSKSDWQNYLETRSQKLAEGILHAGVVFPVLVDAINKVEGGANEDYERYAWYGRVEAILDAKGLRGKEPFESAQKILDNPGTRCFDGIRTLFEITSDEEYV